MQTEKLTKEQFEAICAWAKLYGRTWKSELSRSWFTGNYHGHDEISCYLQQIRNQKGPSWLTRFNLKRAKANYEAGLSAPHLRIIS